MSLFNQIVTMHPFPSLVAQAQVMTNSKPRRGRLLVGRVANEDANASSQGADQMATWGMNTYVCYGSNTGEAATNQAHRSDLRLDPNGIVVI